MEVSAVIPTRGDVDLSPIVESLRRFPAIKEIMFEIGNTPYNRYLGAARARFPIVYTQDDDCVTDIGPILENYRPGVIVNAMTPSHAQAYRGEETLIGLGAIFDRSMVQVLDEWEKDELFLREADRIFATINPHFTVFPEIRTLPCAHNANRYYRQPEHGASHVAIRERINARRNS